MADEKDDGDFGWCVARNNSQNWAMCGETRGWRETTQVMCQYNKTLVNYRGHEDKMRRRERENWFQFGITV